MSNWPIVSYGREALEDGDRFTIAGVHPLYRNPERRWWQFWKPRWLTSAELQWFEVVS